MKSSLIQYSTLKMKKPKYTKGIPGSDFICNPVEDDNIVEFLMSGH